MKLRRSLLISGCDRQDLVEKLARGPEDVAVLELEDGIFETRKELARRQCVTQLRDLDWGSRERIVRINPVATEHGIRDIAVIVEGRPDGILLSKLKSADEIRWASRLLSEAEKTFGVEPGTTKIWTMVESASALLNIDEICAADPRMTGLVLGCGDLGADLQVKRLGLGSFRRTGVPSTEYIYARGRVVAAARAAGIDPIDTGHTTYTDAAATRIAAEFSAQMGFSGAIVFSPRQVPIVNEMFTPPPEDIAWATEVITKFEDANRSEATVVVVDGEMIDGPFVINARQIMERLKEIQAKDALTSAAR